MDGRVLDDNTVDDNTDEAFTTEGKLSGGGTMATLMARKGSLGVAVMAAGLGSGWFAGDCDHVREHVVAEGLNAEVV